MAASIHLHIPEPCHENWQQMTPNEQGRHCLSCQKTVVDFTFMSDQEILDHISRATASVCGRMNKDQLNKVYTEKKDRPTFTFRYAWNMVVATFLLTGNSALAQSNKAGHKKEAVNQKLSKRESENSNMLGFMTFKIIPKRQVHGMIIKDSAGAPIGHASIRIKGVKAEILTDETGRFELLAPRRNRTITLVVSAAGYSTEEYKVPVRNDKLFKILLPAEVETLKPAQVESLKSSTLICNPQKIGSISVDPPIPAAEPPHDLLSKLEGRAGIFEIARQVSVAEKIKRRVTDWLPGKKNVNINPNPAAPGSTININLNLKATGPYKLELMDAAGKIVHVQALQVAQKEQLIQLPTQASWSRGIYWVRISNATDKKVYQAKVVLQ